MKIIVLIVSLFFVQNVYAQNSFPQKCVGTWGGIMYMYGHGSLKDSVAVKLTITPTDKPNTWGWKTAYMSAKAPMTKDYTLRLKDKDKNIFVTDEGNGLELLDYVVENKMYSVFETSGFLLTATYELRGHELIFEVTSGKKQEATHPQVSNYSVGSVQRVVFTKIKANNPKRHQLH